MLLQWWPFLREDPERVILPIGVGAAAVSADEDGTAAGRHIFTASRHLSRKYSISEMISFLLLGRGRAELVFLVEGLR